MFEKRNNDNYEQNESEKYYRKLKIKRPFFVGIIVSLAAPFLIGFAWEIPLARVAGFVLFIKVYLA